MSISREEYATIVSSFLKEIDFQLQPFEFDLIVRQESIGHFASKPWSEEQLEYAVKVAEAVFSCALFYLAASKNIQIKGAIMSIYVAIIDDNPKYLGESLDNFSMNMQHGIPQGHPFLQSFAEFLLDDLKFAGPFIQSRIISDAQDYIAGCIIERDNTRNMMSSSGATSFPKYLRDDLGLGEVYGYLAFAELTPEIEQREKYLPVMRDFRNFVPEANDVMSLYKEIFDGDDKFTYIGNMAKAHDLSIPDALRLVCFDVAQNIKNIRGMLSHPDQADILKIVNGFINGYISWHMQSGRYRLNDVPLIDSENKLMKLTMNQPRPNKMYIQFAFGAESTA